MGIADKVLAISFAADSATMDKFNTIFQPEFQIVHYSPEQLFRLTNQFPTTYYVKNKNIIMEIQGILPCGYLLQQRLNN
jgi:hypothetical protein